MKNGIAVFISLLILFYLTGCFIQASFNIAEWTEGLRFGIATLGVVISGFIAGATADINKEKS